MPSPLVALPSLFLAPISRAWLAGGLVLGSLSVFAAPANAIVFATVQVQDGVNGTGQSNFVAFDTSDHFASSADSRVLAADDGQGTTGTTSSSGSAAVTFANGLLHLSAFASNTVSGLSPRIGGIPIYFGSTDSISQLFDPITVLGGPTGSLAQLHVTFDFSGALTSTGNITTSFAGLLVTVLSSRTEDQRVEFRSINGSQVATPSSLDFLLEYEFGTLSQFNINLTAEAQASSFEAVL